jgi:transcriptional regulator with XRE-family HTH domain
MKSHLSLEYRVEIRKLYGSMIRTLREDKGLSQQALGEMTDMSRSTISKIESGKWNFGIDTLIVLLQKLEAKLFFMDVDGKKELIVQLKSKKWNEEHPSY